MLEEFLVLLIIAPPGVRNRESCVKVQLENFGEPETVRDFDCAVCGVKGGPCVRRQYLARVGPLLLVQLSVYDVSTGRKLNSVRINADCRLTLRVGGHACEYELVAAVEHLGESLTSGHYVCYRRERATGLWRLLNDDGKTFHKPRDGFRDLEHGELLSHDVFSKRQMYLCMYARCASGEGFPVVAPPDDDGRFARAGFAAGEVVEVEEVEVVRDGGNADDDEDDARIAEAKRLSLQTVGAKDEDGPVRGHVEDVERVSDQTVRGEHRGDQ